MLPSKRHITRQRQRKSRPPPQRSWPLYELGAYEWNRRRYYNPAALGRLSYRRAQICSLGSAVLGWSHPSLPPIPGARPQSLINVVWAGAVRNGRENHGISPSESQWHPAAAGVNRWLTTGLLAACGDSRRGRAANVALTFRWIRNFLVFALAVSEVDGIVITYVLGFFFFPQLWPPRPL